MRRTEDVAMFKAGEEDKKTKTNWYAGGWKASTLHLLPGKKVVYIIGPVLSAFANNYLSLSDNATSGRC